MRPTFTAKRKQARKRLLRVANALTGDCFDDDTLIVSTSGRYEFRNKGIDVFIEAINRLRFSEKLNKKVVAFIEVPGWVGGPREDLQARLRHEETFDSPLSHPVYTHWLHNQDNDSVLGMMNSLGMNNEKDSRVKLIFVPCYLTGHDGIFDLSYYDIVLGNDLCVYPSYYEPWGYTPLEAVAFKVPCITTDLAGFGLWANQVKGSDSEIEDGVKVVHRTDYNYADVAESIKTTIETFASFSANEVKTCRANAEKLSRKALWSKFIVYYHEAYHAALNKAEARKTNSY